MCLMPFSKDDGKRESDKYCSYCFKNGEISYKGTDVHEFRKMCYKQMVNNGTPKLLAFFYDFVCPPLEKAKVVCSLNLDLNQKIFTNISCRNE